MSRKNYILSSGNVWQGKASLTKSRKKFGKWIDPNNNLEVLVWQITHDLIAKFTNPIKLSGISHMAKAK